METTKSLNPILSIIIPVYNTERYLSKCLNTVINQSLKEIEIILINDGSTDTSLSICETYMEKDSRIVLIDKKNGGQSSARNLGLDIAKGNYIGFVDSDDWVEHEMFFRLFNKAIETDADIVACNFFKEEKNGQLTRYAEDGHDCIFNRHEALSELLNNKKLTFSLWNKLYKRELFNELRLKEGIILEDIDISYKLVNKTNKVYYLNECLYYYRYNDQSTLGATFSLKRLDEYYVRKDMYDFYCHEYPELSDLMYAEWVFINMEMYYNISIYFKNQVKEFGYLLECNKKNLLRLLMNKTVDRQKKAKILTILFSRKLFLYLKGFTRKK